MSEELYYRDTVIGELPDGWDRVPVDDQLVEIKSGFACAKKHAVPNGVPHLRPFNVTTDGEVVITPDTVEIPHDIRADIESYYLRTGDVLFNNTNSVELVGKTGIVRQPMPVAFSNHIYRLRVRNPEQVDPRWLALALRHLQDKGFFAANCRKWIGQAGFNQTELARVEIPVPSIQEQRRIVARIEALLAEVREMRKLHEEIRTDSDRLLGAFLREKFDELRQEYQLGSLGDESLCEVIPGQHILSRDYTESPPGTPYVTGPADFGDKHPEIARWTTEPKVLSQPGDVLFTVKGSGVGKTNCALLYGECAIGRQIMAIRPNPAVLLTDYLFYNLHGRFEEFQQLRQGAAIPGIRKDHVQAIELPVPPLSIQEGVVSRLEAVHTEIEEMQESNSYNKQLIADMEQAILIQAFCGEL